MPRAAFGTALLVLAAELAAIPAFFDPDGIVRLLASEVARPDGFLARSMAGALAAATSLFGPGAQGAAPAVQALLLALALASMRLGALPELLLPFVPLLAAALASGCVRRRLAGLETPHPGRASAGAALLAGLLALALPAAALPVSFPSAAADAAAALAAAALFETGRWRPH